MLLSRRNVTTIAGILIFIGIIALLQKPLNPVALTMAMLSSNEKAIPRTMHIVLFQFKQGTSQTAIKEITSKMYALKKNCIHPSTGYPYIISISGGRDNSNENLQADMSHAFVLQFYSNEDRDYFVDHDSAHKSFKDAAAVVLEKAQVLDFRDGVFV